MSQGTPYQLINLAMHYATLNIAQPNNSSLYPPINLWWFYTRQIIQGILHG